MADDIVHSIFAGLRERFASPLIGSFSVSWCLWNWKFLVILFSDNTVSTTFQLVKVYVFEDGMSIFQSGVLYPLITSLVYVFLYPYPAAFVYKYGLMIQLMIRDIRRKYEGDAWLDRNEARRIFMRMHAMENEHKEVVDELNAKNEELKMELDALKATLSTGGASVNVSDLPGFSKSQIRILRVLDENDGEMSMQNFRLEIDSGSKIQDDFDVGELMDQGVIEEIPSPIGEDSRISFTHKGRRIWLAMKQN